MTAIEHVSSVEVMTPIEIEARAAQEQIRAGLSDLFEGLARIVEIEGWLVLGYGTFRAWASQELAMSLQNADLHLRKTRRLMEMSTVMGRTIAELAPTVSLRSGVQRSRKSPEMRSMQATIKRLTAVPALTTPDERNAAITLRDALTRVLGE